jgi:hypothetical protein
MRWYRQLWWIDLSDLSVHSRSVASENLRRVALEPLRLVVPVSAISRSPFAHVVMPIDFGARRVRCG